MDLKLLKREIETDGSPVRLTKTKCMILGQYYDEGHEKYGENVKLKRNRDGSIEISWHGHVRADSDEVRECDMGHKHVVSYKRKWTWNYCTLDKRDIEKIREFLA